MSVRANPIPTERLEALPGLARVLPLAREHGGISLVGGAVRDLLLGHDPLDLDLVVEGDLVPILERIGPPLAAHERFGTATVRAGGRLLDLARARRERYPAPGALPEVEPASLEEDLRRRDFTVNAIALPLGGAGAGSLVAVPHALEDLEARRLRVLHERSFLDDPTRLLRLVRYGGRLGFGIEPDTEALGREALTSGALWSAGGARLGAELRLLLEDEGALEGVAEAARLGVLEALHPRLRAPDRALAERALGLLPPDGERDILLLALLARSLPEAEIRALLDRLAFPASTRDRALAAAAVAPLLSERLEAARTPSAVAAAVAGAGVETVALAGALGAEEPARHWLGELRHVRLKIAGDDLIAAGVEAGPAIGRALLAARAATLDGAASTREEQLQAALSAARDG